MSRLSRECVLVEKLCEIDKKEVYSDVPVSKHAASSCSFVDKQEQPNSGPKTNVLVCLSTNKSLMFMLVDKRTRTFVMNICFSGSC